MHFAYLPVVAYLALSPLVSAGVCKHRGKNTTSSASPSKHVSSSTSAIPSAGFVASAASSAWNSSAAVTSTGGVLLASPTSSVSSATWNWTNSSASWNRTSTAATSNRTSSPHDMWNCTDSQASSSRSWNTTRTSPSGHSTGGDLLVSPTPSAANSSKASSRSSASSERTASTSKSAKTTSTASSGDTGSRGSSTTYYATYYIPDGGAGNCGPTIQNSDAVVAINAAQWGAQMQADGWQSVLCGRQVEITADGTGVSVVATIQDQCLKCGTDSLDLTVDLWNQVNAKSGYKFNGVFNMSWRYL